MAKGSHSFLAATAAVLLLLSPFPVAAIPSSNLVARADCELEKVVDKDTCEKIAAHCGSLVNKCDIPNSHFTKYNPASNLCSDLKLKDKRPKKNADGSCAVHTVVKGEYCSVIEASNGLSKDELDELNKGKTWGWSGCDRLWPGARICLSEGDPPMPSPIENAVCGPQKPGTIAPPKGTNISELNPCPLKACCNIWGQCGTTTDFCVVSGDGTPGTAAKDHNGCISNCGTDIVNNKEPPKSFITVGYFEAWNSDRPCLRMDVSEINQEKYSHTHFSFGDITPSFEVDMSLTKKQFDKFLKLTKTKRIVAFGGWAASTSPTTFNIFREGVNPANRNKLATNIANFAKQYNLDGIDIDWEYPAAHDLPHIPPAGPIDGPNYLKFLQLLRSLLPAHMTLSIAAPASYWYLKGFPIAEMAKVLDYIVYMTYDLHGQWDTGSEWSSPGCKLGNCLRSHVNMTETMVALVMVTKAGVPSKIVVGVTSYGRSFKMAQAGCVDEMCTFTGTSNHSDARPGICTGTAGYLSNAEIQLIIENNPTARTFIDKSESNILIYDGTEYVAYMDNVNKARRTQRYKALNFAGTTDWAVDLQTCSPSELGAVTSPEYAEEGRKWYELYCQDDPFATKNITAKGRWTGVMSSSAWNDAIWAWKSNGRQDGTGMEFSDYVGREFFKSEKDSMECGKMLVGNGCSDEDSSCVDRDDYPGAKVGPAGNLINNAMVHIEQAFLNYYTALKQTKNEVNDLIPVLVDKFAGAADDTFAKQMAFNVLATVLSLGLPPMFRNFMGGFGGVGLGGGLGEGIGTLAQNGINMAKDKATGAQEKKLGDASTLLLFMNSTLTIWERSLSDMNKELFNGGDASIEQLRQLVVDGKLNSGVPEKGTTKTEKLSDFEIKSMIKKGIFAYIIPKAWRMGDVRPVVLKTGRKCGSGAIKDKGLQEGTIKAGEYCDDKGNQFVLASIRGKPVNCDPIPGAPQGVPSCVVASFESPDEIEELKKFDLSVEEMVKAAIKTKENNSKKNTPFFNADNVDIVGLYKGGERGINLLDLGMVTIPVCDVGNAWANWQKMTQPKPTLPITYPCDEDGEEE
ncbi:hypothetical protein OQA88_3360 [Cercophora sp. LCS_1]